MKADRVNNKLVFSSSFGARKIDKSTENGAKPIFLPQNKTSQRQTQVEPEVSFFFFFLLCKGVWWGLVSFKLQ